MEIFLNKYQLYFITLKYMKSTQVIYRLFYMLRSKYRKAIKFSYPLKKSSQSFDLNFEDTIYSYISYDNGKFEFLNLSHNFDKNINWNFLDYGKLWVYNLKTQIYHYHNLCNYKYHLQNLNQMTANSF